MNAQETVRLVAMIAALCPGQKIGQHTATAWALVLDDVLPSDAEQAVRTLYRDRGNDDEYGPRRIEADDILREVRRQRNQRIIEGPDYVPSSPELTVDEQIVELREHRRIVGDGGQPPTVGQIGARREPVRALTRAP